MQTVTIFRSDKASGGFRMVREVKAVIREDNKVADISITVYSVGPRGGISYGSGVGFTYNEWLEITEKLAELNLSLSTV